MDINYLAWVFKRTLVVSLLYVIACLATWMFFGARSGWVSLGISVATWLMFFSVHAKDHKVNQRYYSEHRDRFL